MLRKRVPSLLIAAVLLMSLLFGGCRIKGGNNVWFEHSTMKILADYVDPYGKDKYTLYVAKNEYEGCQIAVKTDETYDDFSLELTGPGGTVESGGEVAEGISVELLFSGDNSFFKSCRVRMSFAINISLKNLL